ncbi:type II toxin-antitoxin system RelE/ParE family toxin [Treponema putidum]|nr:type II toxin-antitoxin system RelE/ParE family toxin [Treponema putidum]
MVRIFFTIEDSSLVLLHGFIKKTQKTPLKELTIAISRLREFKEMNK